MGRLGLEREGGLCIKDELHGCGCFLCFLSFAYCELGLADWRNFLRLSSLCSWSVPSSCSQRSTQCWSNQGAPGPWETCWHGGTAVARVHSSVVSRNRAARKRVSRCAMDRLSVCTALCYVVSHADACRRSRCHYVSLVTTMVSFYIPE